MILTELKKGVRHFQKKTGLNFSGLYSKIPRDRVYQRRPVPTNKLEKQHFFTFSFCNAHNNKMHWTYVPALWCFDSIDERWGDKEKKTPQLIYRQRFRFSKNQARFHQMLICNNERDKKSFTVLKKYLYFYLKWFWLHNRCFSKISEFWENCVLPILCFGKIKKKTNIKTF